MPPMEASAPGSMGKNRPSLFTAAFTAMRVTPGCTVTVRSSALMVNTWFMRLTSMLMPPCTASKWPSSEEPTPKGITGTWWVAASLTASATSCVFSANTTAAGGGTAVKADSSRPCCSRTACAVEQRAPNRSCKAVISSGGTRRSWISGARWARGVGAFTAVSCRPDGANRHSLPLPPFTDNATPAQVASAASAVQNGGGRRVAIRSLSWLS